MFRATLKALLQSLVLEKKTINLRQVLNKSFFVFLFKFTIQLPSLFHFNKKTSKENLADLNF